jgi:MerR family transcriptional regulator, copper efflux regulator
VVKLTRSPIRPLRSGEVARLTGVSPDTLRLYERKGLLRSPLRSSNGYRCYPSDAAARVCLIRSALSIGFTLDELSKILKIRDAGGAPCNKVRDLAASKLQGLDRHIRQLLELRDQLRTILAGWDQVLEGNQPNRRAGLLDSLAAASSGKSKPLPSYLYATLSKESSR